MLRYSDRPPKPGKFEILSFDLCAAFLFAGLSVIPPLLAARARQLRLPPGRTVRRIGHQTS